MEDLVIMYHYVMEPEEWKGSVPISPSDFRKQVEWAKEHYEIIKPEDIHKQTQNQNVLFHLMMQQKISIPMHFEF